MLEDNSVNSSPARPPTVGQLRSECHQLIEQISKRPGAAKILLGLLPMLKLYASYKQRRSRTRGSSSN